jgi:hypothetical protein
MILVIGTIITLISLVAGAQYVLRYIKAQNVRGTLAAKDAIIETNQQTIESFQARVGTLEREIKEERVRSTVEKTRASELQNQLETSLARYHDLEKYSAPEAIKRLEDSVKKIEDKLDVDKG